MSPTLTDWQTAINHTEKAPYNGRKEIKGQA